MAFRETRKEDFQAASSVLRQHFPVTVCLALAFRSVGFAVLGLLRQMRFLRLWKLEDALRSLHSSQLPPRFQTIPGLTAQMYELSDVRLHHKKAELTMQCSISGCKGKIPLSPPFAIPANQCMGLRPIPFSGVPVF